MLAPAVLPHQVSFRGSTHWYVRHALCRWGAPAAAKPPPPPVFAALAASGSVPGAASAAVDAVPGTRHAALYVGDTVKRGPDWKWGDQDGGGLGEVTGSSPGDWVKVTWAATGRRDVYRYGHEACYDVELVAAKFTHPDHPHVLTWVEAGPSVWSCDLWCVRGSFFCGYFSLFFQRRPRPPPGLLPHLAPSEPPARGLC